MLSEVDQTRLTVSRAMDPKRKSQLGQFFTPTSIARFMAEMFDGGGKEECRLLDPGAGIGSLSAAFLDRWVSGGLNFIDTLRLRFHEDWGYQSHRSAIQ